MNKKLIGVDCDEVLAELIDSYLKFNQKEYGEFIEKKDILTYDLWKIFNIPREESYQRMNNFFNSYYFDEINPVEFSSEITKTISKNHDLIVVTSRPSFSKIKTKMFIKANFPNTFNEIFHTDEFSLPYFSKNKQTRKTQVCRNLKIDILIEDSLKKSIDCSDIVDKIFLINRPWNYSDNIPSNIIRVEDWRQILSYLS